MQAAASAAVADGVAVPPAAPMPQAPEASVLEKDTGKQDYDAKDDNEGTKEDDNTSETKDQTSVDREEKDGEEKASAPSLPIMPTTAPLGGNSTALNQMLAGMNNPPSQVISLRTSDKSSSLTDSGGEDQKKQPLRRGKWTPEEEAYANRLIQEFKAGLLPLTDGTTLRTFLSKLLNCDPMRISKKFVGSNCIGKQVFRRRGADVNNLTPEQVQQTRLELSELEKKFLDRVSRSKSSKSSSSSGRSKSAEGMAGMGLGGAMNRSAAAAGRALLQSNKTPQAGGAGGLLAQLQSRQPGMFDSSTAGSYLANAGAANQGGIGMANNAPINNLMLQTGLNRDQIAQLASTQMTSSASLANLLGKQRSFDGLMSLDFQSMQSIDNLANLIQAGLPNQVPKAEMRNMDWGSQGTTNQMPAPSGLHGSLNNLATAANLQGSLNKIVRSLSGNRNGSAASGGSGTGFGAAQGSFNSNQANANFGNIMPNNMLQQVQPSSFNPNFGNILQGMGNNMGNNGLRGGAGGNELQSFLQNLQNNNNNNNAGNGNFGQNPNFNPLSQQLNNPLLQQLNNNGSNPFMVMAQQQQLLGGMQLQQNGLGALGGMGNMPVGPGMGNMNLGGNLNLGGGNIGGNLGVGNFSQNQNTANFLQQLLAQQQLRGDGGMTGNKRSLDDADNDGGPTKKASV